MVWLRPCYVHMSVYPSRFCELATVQWYGSGPAMSTCLSTQAGSVSWPRCSGMAQALLCPHVCLPKQVLWAGHGAVVWLRPCYVHMSVYPSRFCELATVQWYGSGPAMSTCLSTQAGSVGWPRCSGMAQALLCPP